MNWEEVRANAAIAAMQTLVGLYNAYDHNTAAKTAVKYADALGERTMFTLCADHRRTLTLKH